MQHDDLELTDLRRRFLKARWEAAYDPKAARLAELLLKEIRLKAQMTERRAA